MTTTLSQAIARCYTVFAHHRPPEHLQACTGCCILPETEREMRTLPLRNLNAHHFWEYNTAAHETGAASAPDVLYLLPRWFELYATGENTGWKSSDLFEGRLGSRPKQFFSPEEWQAIENFAAALFAEQLAKRPHQTGSLPPDELLTACHLSGIDIRPMLDHWLHSDTPAAILHYARTVCYNSGSYPPALCSWMENAEHRRLFAERMLAAVAEITGLPEPILRERYGKRRQEMLDMLEFAYDQTVY